MGRRATRTEFVWTTNARETDDCRVEKTTQRLKKKQKEIAIQFTAFGKRGMEIVDSLDVDYNDFFHGDLPKFFDKLKMFSKIEIIALASAPASLTGTNVPVTPCSIFSGTAPPLAAITGNPAAIASTTDKPKLSTREGNIPRLLRVVRF